MKHQLIVYTNISWQQLSTAQPQVTVSRLFFTHRKAASKYFKIGQNKLKTKNPPQSQLTHVHKITNQVKAKYVSTSYPVQISLSISNWWRVQSHVYGSFPLSQLWMCLYTCRLRTMSMLKYDLLNKPLLKCFKICKAATIQILVSVSCIGFKKIKK